MYPVWPLSSAGFFRSLPHRSTFLSTCCFCWLVLLCWGGNFGVKTAYVTVLSSVLLNIFEKLFPMAHPLTNEIMLELCFAIILPALAAALLFFENASGGGTDIIAMIIKKYSTMIFPLPCW